MCAGPRAAATARHQPPRDFRQGVGCSESMNLRHSAWHGLVHSPEQAHCSTLLKRCQATCACQQARARRTLQLMHSGCGQVTTSGKVS